MVEGLFKNGSLTNEQHDLLKQRFMSGTSTAHLDERPGTKRYGHLVYIEGGR